MYKWKVPKYLWAAFIAYNLPYMEKEIKKEKINKEIQ